MTTRNFLRVPQCDPRAEFLAFKGEIESAIGGVLEGGEYILGEQVAGFEKEFAGFVGSRFCVGVATGTDAIVLALRALGLKRGDAIVTVSLTAVATVAAIELAGLTPVLVDVDPATLTLDPSVLEDLMKKRARIERAIGGNIRAVLPVHLYGRSAAMNDLVTVSERYGLKVVEDCAQAHGARVVDGRRVGTIGSLGAFSFYPTKNLGAIGDGGAVVTDDPETAERLRSDRQYGWRERYVSEFPGMNSRLDTVQAAILRVKLKHLEDGNAQRRRLARCYDEGLAGTDVVGPARAAEGSHVYHQYVVRHARRENLREGLSAMGIGTLVHYPKAVHQQPAYAARLFCLPEDLPVTTKATGEVLSLPMHSQLSVGTAETVAATVLRALEMMEGTGTGGQHG